MSRSPRSELKRLIGHLRLYSAAARLLDAYRLLARPHLHGALVAIWCEQRLLLVKCSYRESWSLPGGGLERGETARAAAVRELAEELGLTVDPENLRSPWQITKSSAWGKDTITIFTLPLAKRPLIAIDGLEIVDVSWLRREEALEQLITSHLREYLLDQPVP